MLYNRHSNTIYVCIYVYNITLSIIYFFEHILHPKNVEKPIASERLTSLITPKKKIRKKLFLSIPKLPWQCKEELESFWPYYQGKLSASGPFSNP
mmetsp:Transcript_18006/g.25232  ORF Transcript_18006/g.25232 Transcript_18006/m.25232 type:complete len:95 (+) Transcript_18006:233-517(+)